MPITRFSHIKPLSLGSLLWLTAVFLFTPVHYAHAYLDGGTGSYIIQVAIGLIVSVGYLFRTMGGRIKLYLAARKDKKKNNDKKTEDQKG